MSQKIVINECFGGFGLSHEAFLRLRELGCRAALQEPDIGELWPDGSGPRKSYWGDSFGDDIPRDDPLLVQVVKEMGEEADGFCAQLKVVTIPDGVDWEIDEYDGSETIHEKHRSWR